MANLQLTPDEERLLSEVLERSIKDIEVEVDHTDLRDFKAMLKQRRELLTQLRNRIAGAAPGA